MIGRSLLDDPVHWRKRAEQTRSVASRMDDTGKARLLRVAEEYDRLAETAERRLDAIKQEAGKSSANDDISC